MLRTSLGSSPWLDTMAPSGCRLSLSGSFAELLPSDRSSSTKREMSSEPLSNVSRAHARTSSHFGSLSSRCTCRAGDSGICNRTRSGLKLRRSLNTGELGCSLTGRIRTATPGLAALPTTTVGLMQALPLRLQGLSTNTRCGVEDRDAVAHLMGPPPANRCRGVDCSSLTRMPPLGVARWRAAPTPGGVAARTVASAASRASAAATRGDHSRQGQEVAPTGAEWEPGAESVQTCTAPDASSRLTRGEASAHVGGPASGQIADKGMEASPSSRIPNGKKPAGGWQAASVPNIARTSAHHRLGFARPLN